MLSSHGPTPRLLYDSSLSNPVLPLEVRSQALALVPPVDPGRLPDDRVGVLASFVRAGRYGIPHLDLVGTARFIKLLLLKHAKRPRSFADILQVLRLHHDLLLVRFGA